MTTAFNTDVLLIKRVRLGLLQRILTARLPRRSWSDGNNCDCHDHCDSVECFAGDVNATLAFGFDSIKLDGCGKEEDVALWNEMFNHSIRMLGANHSGMMIEK